MIYLSYPLMALASLRSVSRTLAAATVLICASSSVQAQARFGYSADGAEVTDAQTGLIWRRCVHGQTWTGSTCAGFGNTLTYEQALAFAKSQPGWRLPSVKELSSLVDASRVNPSIDPAAFPAAAPASWASTPNARNSSEAWLVLFYDGYVGTTARNNTLYLRLVR